MKWKSTREAFVCRRCGISKHRQSGNILEANAIVAYAVYTVHTVLLNFSLQFWWYLIDQGYTKLDLLPVSTTATTNCRDEYGNWATKLSEARMPVFPLQNSLSISMQRYARNIKI